MLTPIFHVLGAPEPALSLSKGLARFETRDFGSRVTGIACPTPAHKQL